MRGIIAEHPIYLIVDETTDSCNRNVMNVLVGPLSGEYVKPMLVITRFIETVNNETVSKVIFDSLQRIWPQNIIYKNVHLVVSDQASYMLVAMKKLKELS